MKTELLKINLNKELDLCLVINIKESNGETMLSNSKLNIRTIYDGATIFEGKKLFTEYVIETIIDYIKTGILNSVFESIDIKIVMDSVAKKTLSPEVNKLLKEEEALILKKGKTISLNEFNYMKFKDFSLAKIYNNCTWK